MPAQPRWLTHLPRILAELESIPDPWLDRQTVQQLLGVKIRRAQQIMNTCAGRTVGTSSLVDRQAFIQQLKRIQSGEAEVYEQKRRQRVALVLHELSTQRAPELKVEAPAPIVNQAFENLPPGVDLGKGRITIYFNDPKEALEKLLALAMAVGNDYDSFEKITTE
jgi:hypothetical protein